MKKFNYMIMINFILIFALLLSITISGLSADKVINWRLQSMCAAGDFGFEGAKMFAEQVTEASGGRLVVKAFTARFSPFRIIYALHRYSFLPTTINSSFI